MPTKPLKIVDTSLQEALVDLTDLALQGKQAHWNLHGSHFRAVHLHLDEIVAQVRAASDEVAERLVAVGGTPDGRPATVAESSGLPALDGGPIATDKAIRMFEERLQTAADRIKANLDALDEKDHLSADLLIGIATGLEKQAWMLRASAAD
ncbi:DNA starvation/stationary phase protection protein [Georgenia yuyongxinii]|uniref:DNA starvation/stationary phase protection protein n=1 Tax=Georgenia yuyongxinii TaxID=2589797 RepID=A0A5B8C3A8_9MICO|nr:DNA starvation/stationary phase protection protein [Georgenia yuyongxinii]QDC24738.1 DNA starvation/stationary phase protection protein [Georgenia yuyongxinii]